jgi:hypothetical protein
MEHPWRVIDTKRKPVQKTPARLEPMSVKEYLDLNLFEPVEALVNKARTIVVLRMKREDAPSIQEDAGSCGKDDPDAR